MVRSFLKELFVAHIRFNRIIRDHSIDRVELLDREFRDLLCCLKLCPAGDQWGRRPVEDPADFFKSQQITVKHQ
jgi:hypothetical protein